MSELKVVPFRAVEKRADKVLLTAFEQITDVARSGNVQRMVMVWTDAENAAHCVAYRANDLTLIGALNVTVSGLQSKWDT